VRHQPFAPFGRRWAGLMATLTGLGLVSSPCAVTIGKAENEE